MLVTSYIQCCAVRFHRAIWSYSLWVYSVDKLFDKKKGEDLLLGRGGFLRDQEYDSDFYAKGLETKQKT